MLLTYFLSYLYMHVLKLTLGKIFFCKFSSSFRFLVWNVRIDLLLCPDVYGFHICTMLCYVRTHAFFFPECCSYSRPSDKLVFRSDMIFSGKIFVFLLLLAFSTTLHCLFIFFVLYFSRGFIQRFWHSLHISSHSHVFSLTSLILLSFGPF